MQAIQSRVESRGLLGAPLKWLGHNVVWLGAIGMAFFLGAAWMNGRATTQAVASVQTTYRGKLDYHVQHERVLAKTAESAAVACQHNAVVAMVNGAEVQGCPPPPK